MGQPDFDPRDIVTPHAFGVDEALLNTPLATPWRRLVAFLLDLGIAGIIANVAGALVGIPVAYVFYRVTTRTELASRWKRWARGCLVGLGALLLFAASIALVQNTQEWGASGPGLTALLPGVQPAQENVEQEPDGDDPGAGHTPEHTEPNLEMPFLTIPRAERSSAPPSDPERGAELLNAYAQALTERDTAAIDSLQGPVQSFVAGSELDELESRLNRAGAENSELEAEVARLRAQVQEPSIWRMARATANDFGITIGWVGLYFTLFLAWWSGRTPGKYFLGIRVVQLNGAPITLWAAFERFGGYAAGIATGLLGFVQLYWDPNRQAIHDRVARTVVIQTREE